jgi:hypothetical protein
MTFEFIEGRKTGDKVEVQVRGVRIWNEEIVHYKGESGGVGVVAEEHEGGGLKEAMLTRRSWDKSPDWGRPGTVFIHHRRGRVCRGSDGGKVGDRV